LTVSGVAATRGSAPVSATTATFMSPPRTDASAAALQKASRPGDRMPGERP
jgi:hypothetical protein